MQIELFENPYRPGAGHMPPYLAGREQETGEFLELLTQRTILNNVVLTGLRGVGKTVLLESLKPKGLDKKWLWVSSDLSEASSISENAFAQRIITDLSVVTANITLKKKVNVSGFGDGTEFVNVSADFQYLSKIYSETPGLVSDKLKSVLNAVWSYLNQTEIAGIVFAYDEAQIMSDHRDKDQYPLALLLDVFQSIQRAGVRYILVLSGLPTLYPKLVESRTYSERMFRVIELGRLSAVESRDAIIKPLEQANTPMRFTEESINLIIGTCGGYPYFIQFICKEVYDILLQRDSTGNDATESISLAEVAQKLDRDFFSPRYERLTDRQRELMEIICEVREADTEFSIQDIVSESKKTEKPFSGSHVNQMLSSLINKGLVYKNRFGKYCFAVPQWVNFLKRR